MTKAIIELARDAGSIDSPDTIETTYAAFRAFIIAELAGVEMPEPAFKNRHPPEPLPTNYYTADQLRTAVAAAVLKAVAAEREDANLQTYKDAIKQVRGLNEQIAKRDAEIAHLRQQDLEQFRALLTAGEQYRALTTERDALAKDAARYRWLRDNSTEQLLNQSRANLNNDFAPMDIRTYWKTPTLICSGPVGGFITFEDAIDEAMK